MRAGWTIFLVTVLLLTGTGPVAAQCAVGSVQFENDVFGGGSDRHFTHGSRVSCISADQAPGTWARDLGNALSFDVGGVPMLVTDGDVRYSFALGQNMFTPEDLTRRDLIRSERPYAGWLYGSLGLVLGPPDIPDQVGTAAFDRMETIEFTLGVVGPASGAAETQRFIHNLIGSTEPRGWDNQLRNELGVMVSYEHKWRTEAWSLVPGSDDLKFDLMPAVGGAFGNVHTFGSLSVTARVGTNLANDFGPPRIRPSVAGSEYYNPEAGESLSAYLFVSAGSRIVGRNIFLDGNTFRSSHSVDKELLVHDIQFGVVVSLWGRARLSFTNIFRTREFEKQDGIDEFGAVSLSFRF